MSGPAFFYAGSVLHRRLRPAQHVLKHACYWMLLDIDRIDETAARLRLFSHNRFNVLAFHDRDHGDGGSLPLRTQVEALLRGHHIKPPGGVIRLFCMPRVFGYGFNPISIFFCHDDADRLKAIVYEVHNTFGERHHYVFSTAGDANILRHACEKDFYVSPFMDIEMSYSFRVVPPDEKFSVSIDTQDREGSMLLACLVARRREFSDATLLALALRQPLLTLKVIAAIHVHAAILWWKGLKIRRWKKDQRRSPSSQTSAHRDATMLMD